MILKRWGLVLLTWSSAAVVAPAATTTVSPPGGAPTPGIAAQRTYTLTVTSSLGKIIGFNFDRANNAAFGIVGMMNQVTPFGQMVVFDPGPPRPTVDDSLQVQDSYFLVKALDGVGVNAMESADYMGAAFNFTPAKAAAATNTLPFIQIIKPPTAAVRLRGQFTIATPSGNVLEDYSFAIPEPSAALLTVLARLGLVPLLGRCRDRLAPRSGVR